jgi:hypothetical protein
MANVPANTYTTYDTAGMREDLIDVITNISPTDAWCLSNFGTTKATGRYHEWLTDVLDTPGDNIQAEGDDYAATAITPPVRAGNYCQTLAKIFRISNAEEAVNKAGRTSEIAYQTTNKLKALSKDIEYMLIINTASASGASGTGRRSKGLAGWISTNSATAGQGTASASALTETILNDCLQMIWAQGGDPQHVLCGAFQKRKIDSFSTNTRQIMAEDKTIVAAVDVYKSSFGNLAVHLSTQMNTSLASTIYVLGDLNLWKKAWLRPIEKKEMGITGSSRKFYVEAELCLECRQEKGSGKIIYLTSS